MGNNTVLNVHAFGATMNDAEYNEALAALGGVDVASSDYDRIAVVAATAGQARHGFIDMMHRLAGDGGKVEWIMRPVLGKRRKDAAIEHVITARFRVAE